MKLSNRAYDALKPWALWVLPLSAFVSSLGQIWNLPHAEQISLTLVALDTLLGAVLQISSNAYYKDNTNA